MPYQAVTVDLQSQLLGISDELVGYTEVEDTFCRCQNLWFHAVFCYYAVEMFTENGIGLRNLSVALPLVDGCTHQEIFANGVFEALCRHAAQRGNGHSG